VICVLGDAHLDVVVCPKGPIAEETDTPSRTWVGAGGQAANVAAWVCALGGQAQLIAARAGDLAAGLVAADLARRGVRIAGPVVDGGTGVVVSLSDHGTSRSMLTDRGVGPLLRADALADDWFTGSASTCRPRPYCATTASAGSGICSPSCALRWCSARRRRRSSSATCQDPTW
jgi:sugar/nucleoside kinase (ribokinase family)